MRMLVSVEFADAGTKSGTHRVLIIGRGPENPAAGDIGLSLEEAKTLIGAIESEFVSAQAAEIVEARRQCSCGKKLAIKDWKLRRIHDIRSGLPAESSGPELHLQLISASSHLSSQRISKDG
jgi:hypothetical protein